MVQDYENEQNKLIDKLSLLSTELSELDYDVANLRNLVHSLKRYTCIDKLDREAVVEFIDKIIVSRRYEVNGVKQQDVNVYYNFIGKVDIKNEVDKKTDQMNTPKTDKHNLSA